MNFDVLCCEHNDLEALMKVQNTSAINDRRTCMSTNTKPAAAASRPTDVELFIAGEPTLGILMRQCKTSAVSREMKRDLFSRPYRRRHARSWSSCSSGGGAALTWEGRSGPLC